MPQYLYAEIQLHKIDANKCLHLKAPFMVQNCFAINCLYIIYVLNYDVFWNTSNETIYLNTFSQSWLKGEKTLKSSQWK